MEQMNEMAPHKEPKSHVGLIEDPVKQKFIDLAKKLGVSDETIEKLEDEIGAQEDEEKEKEEVAKEEGKGGEKTGPEGSLKVINVELPNRKTSF